MNGRVQGVGFRPHVFKLAKKFNLQGTVSNNEEGVVIQVSGTHKNIHDFYNHLITNPPKVSKITNHHLVETDYMDFDGFAIVPSQNSGKLNLQLTPDFAICKECKEEITDKNNVRYHYPFTTCVNCGPRWAITNSFPFERNHTNIDAFNMCDSCEKEYGNPLDRRFHSQTNSCSNCGISLNLTNSDGTEILADNIFKKIADLILAGHIIAIKNTSGYLLCCDASNVSAVKRLRLKKNRPTKPFAILYPSLSQLKQHLSINEEQEGLLTSPESPIVILPKKDFKGNLALNELAPGLNQLGVMLPYSGILYLLALELNIPIVATSGNIHGSPIISSSNMAHEELKGIADYFLDHNLKIANPQDDSVVKFSVKLNEKVLFRRSRGLSPNFDASVKIDEKVMAMGGHLKSTITFVPNDYIYVSQYLGNLDHYDVYDRYIQTVTKFTELFEQTPEAILTDKHPAYHSTQYGIELSKKWKVSLKQIQHHKAHFTSVLGEHGLFDSSVHILGVIWDGTGYGDDTQIWGGEFFSFYAGKMKRVGHFDYFDWLAGDKMAKEPRISLLSLTNDKMQSVLKQKFTEKEISIYKHLKSKASLKTSSVGRLFDATASLLGLCDINTYEGEAAILLESQINHYNLEDCQSYVPEIKNGIVPTQELFYNLYNDYMKGVTKEEIIINFLYSLANCVFKMAEVYKITEIAFSGGVFQNTVLVDMLKEMSGSEYKLYFNRNLSPNDENISFGQIMYHQHVKN